MSLSIKDINKDSEYFVRTVEVFGQVDNVGWNIICNNFNPEELTHDNPDWFKIKVTKRSFKSEQVSGIVIATSDKGFINEEDSVQVTLSPEYLYRDVSDMFTDIQKAVVGIRNNLLEAYEEYARFQSSLKYFLQNVHKKLEKRLTYLENSSNISSRIGSSDFTTVSFQNRLDYIAVCEKEEILLAMRVNAYNSYKAIQSAVFSSIWKYEVDLLQTKLQTWLNSPDKKVPNYGIYASGWLDSGILWGVGNTYTIPVKMIKKIVTSFIEDNNLQ